MATTTRGIVYPTVGDTLTPLADKFAALATSADTAISDAVAVIPPVFAAGPASQTDYGTSETQILTISVPVISGRKYKVSALIGGAQVTSTGTLISRLRSGATVGVGSSGADVARLVTGLSVPSGTAAAGYTSYVYTAASTTTVVFALTSVTTAGAFRVGANQCQLLAEILPE